MGPFHVLDAPLDCSASAPVTQARPTPVSATRGAIPTRA
jgi:hypothetical protein